METQTPYIRFNLSAITSSPLTTVAKRAVKKNGASPQPGGPPANGAAKPPPAYLLSLSLQNLRCFGPRQTLDLSDGHGRPRMWTLILGENGTGKTTLLQAIAAMQPQEFITLQSSDSNTLSDTESSKKQWGSYPTFRLGVDESDFRDEDFIVKIDLHLMHGKKISLEYNFSVSLYPGNSVVSQDLSNTLFYAYGASRRMSGTSLAETEKQDIAATLFSDDESLPNAEEWLLQMDYAARSAEGAVRQEAEQRRDQIKEILIGLLPDVTDIRFASPKTVDRGPRVEFRTPYGWVKLDRLGLGYRTMMAWTVDLARRLVVRYPDSPNPLAEPAIVLVDEIDLHLHPRWQREIIGFLSERFPQTQFIATAHSPLIVQAAQDANLVVLRREGDHVVIDNDVETIRNWRVDQIYTSLFGIPSRPPVLDGKLKERREILSKPELTAADRKRLKALEAEIGDLPTGESREEIEAMEIIRRVAGRLSQSS